VLQGAEAGVHAAISSAPQLLWQHPHCAPSPTRDLPWPCRFALGRSVARETGCKSLGLALLWDFAAHFATWMSGTEIPALLYSGF